MHARARMASAIISFWAILWAAAVPAWPVDWPWFQAGVQVGTVQEPDVTEASGLGGSRANPGVLWVHNDSGDSARAFAMDTLGNALGTYNIVGADAVDWEDMTVGPGPVPDQQYLYLGDIGDNLALRGGVLPAVKVYRVAEPTVALDQTPGKFNLAGAEAITLVYPDGARDAETLMVDPITGDLYVVSKRETLSRVYRAPAGDLVDGATVTLEFKAELPWGWATGGDISPDGRWILIRGYDNASLWTRPEEGDLWEAFDQPPVEVPLISEPQGEAVGFDANGWGYFTVSEGTAEPIYHFAVGPPIPGDANLDGVVNGADYTVWADHYGQSPVPPWEDCGWSVGNFNDDDIVHGADYTVWADHYGSEAASAPVPEPASMWLLAVAGAALARGRKRRGNLRPA